MAADDELPTVGRLRSTSADTDIRRSRRRSASPPRHEAEHPTYRKRSRIDSDDASDRSRQSPAASRADHPRRDSPPKPDAAAVASLERRHSATQEEKKRGKRLFGGLLSTLSQTSSSSHQKRRQEIERRQQDRISKQKADVDHRRSQNLDRLRGVRLAQQSNFDDKVIKAKHTKKLALAHFLSTSAEPRIYYRPHKLTAEQLDIIDEQVHSAKADRDEELETSGSRRRSRQSAAEESRQPSESWRETSTSAAERVPERRHSSHSQAAETYPAQIRAGDDYHPDDSGDVVVEADEDMLIY